MKFKQLVLILITVSFQSLIICSKLTLSMVVKNEANRYLKTVLEEHKKYIDSAVIIDDASIDNTVEVCKEVLKDIPLKIVQNKVSKFSNEVELRKQQWEETIKTNPDWILNLDADEVFETKFAYTIRELIKDTNIDVYCFRLYDFWNITHYRQDKYWRSHFFYRPFLVRYKKDFNYKWSNKSQHCGRFPKNIMKLRLKANSLRLKHYGWAKEEDRIIKYKRYQELDPQAKYGCKEQYESILDSNPTLVEWIENQ